MTPDSSSDGQPPAAQHTFHTTQWGVVHAARSEDNAPGSEALAGLCATYWYPLYAFIRRQGFQAHEAEDLTQEFFQDFLQRRSLQSVSAAEGRFRSFLLQCVKHFLAVRRERAEAQRRGGESVIVPLELATAETHYLEQVPDNLTPELLFERQWAFTVLAQAFNRLQRRYASSNRTEQFQAVKGFLPGSLDGCSHAETAIKHGMSLRALTVAVSRVRREFGVVLRHEVERTVATAQEVDDEIRHLISVLGSA